MTRFRWLPLLLLLGFTSWASAGFTTAVDNSYKHFTTGVLTFDTHGGDMAGMVVTAYFSDSTSNSAVWTSSSTGPGSTGQAVSSVSGHSWSLTQTGHTFDTDVNGTEWVLTNFAGSPNMTRLVIDAGVGGITFDRVIATEVTLDSKLGRNITNAGGTFAGDVLATYRNPIVVGSLANPLQSPTQDLYGLLDMQFSGSAFAATQTLKFWADTDNLASAAVPEPTSLALVSMFAGALFIRRRAS